MSDQTITTEPVTPEGGRTAMERLGDAVGRIDAARRELLSAASYLDHSEIPSDIHRGCLMTMDACRDLEARITKQAIR